MSKDCVNITSGADKMPLVKPYRVVTA